jgi:hypothetical protein
MHFEFLVEDQSGNKSLKILMPQLINIESNSYRIHFYRGGGKDIPKKSKVEPHKRIFFDRLPALINGFGKTFAGYGADYKAVLIVICDLDTQDKTTFLNELNGIMSSCSQKPDTYFCLSIEEFEAWYLGDMDAIKSAYPYARQETLDRYDNDSICGTWELLADAIYKGGSGTLKKRGWQSVGAEKSKWAENISPCMNIDNNKSPSFKDLKTQLLKLAE